MDTRSMRYLGPVIAAASVLLVGSGGAFAGIITWTEGIIATFTTESTGLYPVGVPYVAMNGVLYGATQEGGSNPDGACDGGCGTVYELLPPSRGQSGWTRKVIHAFAGYPSDGWEPLQGLIADHGALYGTTQLGGVNTPNGEAGTVFRLAPPMSASLNWTETVVHAFSGKDGLSPNSRLVADARGALYGTTAAGGAYDNFGLDEGGGTVYGSARPRSAMRRGPNAFCILLTAATPARGTSWSTRTGTCMERSAPAAECSN